MKAEWFATLMENMVRGESSLPLRSHYDGDQSGPTEASRIVAGTEVLWRPSGGDPNVWVPPRVWIPVKNPSNVVPPSLKLPLHSNR